MYCPVCGNKKLQWNGNGELVCKACGAVIKEAIYSGEKIV